MIINSQTVYLLGVSVRVWYPSLNYNDDLVMAEKQSGTALLMIPEIDRKVPQKRGHIKTVTLIAKLFEMVVGLGSSLQWISGGGASRKVGRRGKMEFEPAPQFS